MPKDHRRNKPTVGSRARSRTESSAVSDRHAAKNGREFRGSQREFLQSLKPGGKLTVTLPGDKKGSSET